MKQFGLRTWTAIAVRAKYIAALVLFALTCALAPALAFAADGPYYIHATEVNLREQPNGEIILVFEPNDKVFIVSKDGNWSYVSAPVHDVKGWCWSAYIGEDRLAVETETDGASPAENAIGEILAERDENVVELTAVPVKKTASAVLCIDPGTSNVTVEDTVVAASSPVPVITGNAVPDAGFIPDDASDTTTDAATDWRPEPEQPSPEELSSAFYQTFEQSPAPVITPATITTPLMMESMFYRPIGGNDIALINGHNVNVRQDASLKSNIVGSVDTGDKAYIVGFDDPWYLVSIPARDIQGYVYSQYVSELPRVEISGNQVRMRESASTSARIKTELNDGEVFYEFERKGKWALLASSASGLKGWVHVDYIRKTERSANRPYRVSGESVNFRASPNVDAVIISALTRSTEVAVLGRNEKWSFIEYRDQQGWMYSEYLQPVGRGTVVAQSELGLRLISRAKAMQGTPYVWGGESNGGVDCSGLIYKLLLDEGAEAKCLPRRASTQMAGLGIAVDKENLAPGDLVFFTTYKSGASHVGIYLGDGDFIHASSAQGKVCISNMSDGYYKKRFVGARRITEEELRGMM